MNVITIQTPRRGRVSRIKSAGDTAALPVQFLNNTCINCFDLENEGQDRGVQHSSWCYSMANVNLYKSHNRAFFASINCFRDIHISKFVTLKM